MDCQILPFSFYVHALITFQLIIIAKVLFIKLVEFIKRFKTARKLTKSVNVSQRYRARSEVVVGRMVGQISWRSPPAWRPLNTKYLRARSVAIWRPQIQFRMELIWSSNQILRRLFG